MNIAFDVKILKYMRYLTKLPFLATMKKYHKRFEDMHNMCVVYPSRIEITISGKRVILMW